MAPRGVTNHFGRISIPNDPIHNDDDFNKLMENIRTTMMETVDRVMTCEPDYLVMGMSSETFWDGLEGSKLLQQRVEQRAGVKVCMGSDASQEALKRYGAKRLGVITPYMPVGDGQVRKFFEDCGFEIVKMKGLKCQSPVLIAHVSERELRDAIVEVNGARRRRRHPGRHQPGHGAACRHRRVLARQAGAGDQHLHLLVGAAPERHRRPDRWIRVAVSSTRSASSAWRRPASDRAIKSPLSRRTMRLLHRSI